MVCWEVCTVPARSRSCLVRSDRWETEGLVGGPEEVS